jgi:hypothetical protein
MVFQDLRDKPNLTDTPKQSRLNRVVITLSSSQFNTSVPITTGPDPRSSYREHPVKTHRDHLSLSAVFVWTKNDGSFNRHIRVLRRIDGPVRPVNALDPVAALFCLALLSVLLWVLAVLMTV